MDLVDVARLASPSSKEGVDEALVNNVEEADEEASRPTCRVARGEVVPMPTLPAAVMVRYCAPDEEATVNIGIAGAVLEPTTDRLAMGVEELMPTW